MGIVILAVIFIAVVAVFSAIDRTIFHPLAQAKNLADDPEYRQNRSMANDMGLLVVIAAIVLIAIAATGQ